MEPEKFSWSPVKSRRCRSSVSCSANGGATVQRNWRRQRQLRRADVTLLLPRRTNKLTTKIDKSLLYQIRWRLYRPISNVYAFCPASDRRLRKLTNAKDPKWVNLISPRFSIFFFKRLLCRLLKICRKSVSRIELWVVDAAFVKQKPLKRFKNSSWDNHQLRCRFWSRLGRDCFYCWRINIY